MAMSLDSVPSTSNAYLIAHSATPRPYFAPTTTASSNVQLESDNVFSPHSKDTIQLWATISQMLWWTVLLVSSISIPILSHALYVMLKKFKKSNYFHFLTTMIVLNLLMVISILFNLLSDYAFSALKGSMMCKITAFVTNVTSCYSNWLWVMMFAQRFVHIFFPMHRWRGKPDDEGALFRILDDTPRLILITGVMAVGTQMWAPFLMKEVVVLGQTGVVGCYCGPDSTLVNQDLFKYIVAAESVWTYAMPFLITLLTDLAVLIYPLHGSTRFTIITTEEVLSKKKSITSHQITTSNAITMGATSPFCNRRNSILAPSSCVLPLQSPHSLKIQSEDSIRQCHKRRQRAIRRCLMLATMQLLLNLPNYVLQLVDEFSNLRVSSEEFAYFYLHADALFYLLYLSQYPMLAVYIQWLHGNYNKTSGSAIHSSSNSAIPGIGTRQLTYSATTPATAKHSMVDYSPIARKVTASMLANSVSTTSSALTSSRTRLLANFNGPKQATNNTIPKRHSTGCVLLQQ